MSREIDAKIAKYVMGWTTRKTTNPFGYYGKELPNFSTDISSAWEVIDKVNLRLELTEYKPDDGPRWMVKFMGDGHVAAKGESDSAPMSICIAALRAVGIEVDNK